MLFRGNRLLPGKTPADVHTNDEFFDCNEQLPGVATHRPLSQYGVFELHMIEMAGFSTPATHSCKA